MLENNLRSLAAGLLFLSACAFQGSLAAQENSQTNSYWWKGNLHTHTLWSDGDDYPEMAVDWYKQHGYQFLALSDHNTLQAGERWLVLTNKAAANALPAYIKRFGKKWVEQRKEGTNQLVLLKPLNEFRVLFETPDKFLLIPSEEVSDRHLSAPVHINAQNIREPIKPRGGNSVLEVMQNNVNAILDQRARTGQPMMPHLNHPNWQWGVTAEEIMQVKGERFFEVYNGHRGTRHEGDETHASLDRIWDIILTRRLTELNMEPMYATATDDAHQYQSMDRISNPGRGWVVVRAPRLTAENIVNAMEAGDFYSSTGVRLKEMRRDKSRYSIEIEPDKGVTYRTQFIGTRKGFDPKNEPVRAANGTPLRVTHRYSKDIGEVLAEVSGVSPSYELKGDEIYVRAKIVSSKPKENPYAKGEFEVAWTQPLITGVK